MTGISNFSSPVTFIALPIFSLSLGILLWKIYKRKVFTYVGFVKDLYFYPVKSLKRVDVKQLECTPIGVRTHGFVDRNFMLISGDHDLISQREEPSLALLNVTLAVNRIDITTPKGNNLTLEPPESDNKFDKVITCRVHSTKVEVVDCGDVPANFFNEYLGRKDVRLVHYASFLPKRQFTGKEQFFDKLIRENPTALQDLSPVNLLAESSVDALNSRLEEKISEHNFRPNIYIAGSPPFDEDNWKNIKFSSGAEVESLLPCDRCLLTTNNPETGIKSNKDPLTTLRKFRILKDSKLPGANLLRSPCFAVNCWVRETGIVSVGDYVTAVVEKERLIFKEEL